MKNVILFFSLFASILSFANDNDKELTVQQEGLTIEVLYFEEGDKLKLFEAETGDHILSKTYASIDLSQLPIGSYVLENNNGQAVYIDRLEAELMIDGAIIFAGDTDVFVEEVEENQIEVVEDAVAYHTTSQKNLLSIQRDGDVITVIDFEEGDKLKLFEVKDTVHVLSKTTNVVDLSLLTEGMYLLENTKGQSIVIEKLDVE